MRHLMLEIHRKLGGLTVLAFLTGGLSGQLQAQDREADNVLIFQRSVGGWSKEYKGKQPVDYSKEYGAGEKAAILDDSSKNDATIDNGATIREIRLLAKAYKSTKNSKYLEAASKGIRYLLKAQYSNGGWPQFYPDLSSYRNQVTYNDNAMANVLNLMQDIALGANGFDDMDATLAAEASKAVEKGIGCILATQIKVNGKLTVWCAQYDSKTLQPAKARAFELVSLSGMESVALVEFLMRQKNPSPAIKAAVEAAVLWFQQVKITGIAVVAKLDSTLPQGRDRVVVPDSNSTLWARFYDIGTNEPFFCGRDGIKKKTLAEIEHERRVGYAWYGKWPVKLLEISYPAWKKLNG